MRIKIHEIIDIINGCVLVVVAGGLCFIAGAIIDGLAKLREDYYNNMTSREWRRKYWYLGWDSR